MLSTPNSRPLPACGVISSFQSLRDALRGEAVARLAKEFYEFMDDATPEEIAFLGQVFEARNQLASGDFRLADAIEWTAGNSHAILAGDETTDSAGPVQGWATITNEETKQPAEGAAA